MRSLLSRVAGWLWHWLRHWPRKKILIPDNVGDRVKVRDGTFAGMEGEVKDIVHPADAKENPKVKVVLSIWGRPVDVDVEYWQVEQV